VHTKPAAAEKKREAAINTLRGCCAYLQWLLRTP
jgi:hypothetical protein